MKGRPRIGRVVAPHGLRGALRCDLALEEAFGLQGKAVWLKGQARQVLGVQRLGGSRWILRLEGIGNRAEAEAFRGEDLYLAWEDLPPLPEGTFYVGEILGFAAVTPEGETLGQLVDVWHLPAHDVYVVEGPKGRRLVPAVKAIIRALDRERRVMVVDLPEEEA
ncbi:MAG: ribosome maturation factor RimM [Clostridiales bacterium]|nr:ribosome maturation factor RimM [Clostridiales bacterium]